MAKPISLVIGALGKHELNAGRYLYIGSGQQGLSSRIARHFARHKITRWHIDYLSTAEHVRVLGAAVWERRRAAECEIARAAAGLWGIAVPGFGASDCNCPGHLIGPVPRRWQRMLEEVVGAADAKIACDENQRRRGA